MKQQFIALATILLMLPMQKVFHFGDGLLLAQAQLVIGNTTPVYLTMHSNAVRGGNPIYLVVDNSASNSAAKPAIIQNQGWIISEGENNMLKWDIGGTSSGTYTVPWGYSTSTYIPLSFTMSAAGSPGTGYINFSTYRTTWDNSNMLPLSGTNPPTNYYSSTCSCVADRYGVDRFYSIDASSYTTTKPNLSNLIFTYVYGSAGNPEVLTTNNTITESDLQAQRWNSTALSWQGAMFGTDNTGTHQVTIPALTGSTDLYKWWTLVDNISPLPIELLYFTATLTTNQQVLCQWETASEMNSDYFLVEKTRDNINYDFVAKVNGAGNSSTVLNYSALDTDPYEGTSYYRLKQVDLNGAFTYSQLVPVNLSGIDIITVYPNPGFGNIDYVVGSTKAEEVTVKVYDAIGREVVNKEEIINNGITTKHLNVSMLAAGSYMLRITTATMEKTQKQFVVK